MPKNSKNLALSLLLLFTLSCNNDESVQTLINSSAEQKIVYLSGDTKYNGTFVESEQSIDFFAPSVAIKQKIENATKAPTASFYNDEENGILYVFDDAESNINFLEEVYPQTSSATYNARFGSDELYIYRDSGYRTPITIDGKSNVTFAPDWYQSGVAEGIESLSRYPGANDAISSIKGVTFNLTRFAFYEHSFFRGKSFTLTGVPPKTSDYSFAESNLAKKNKGLFTSWNDKIGSIKWFR